MTIQLVTGITGCRSGEASPASITWRIATTLPVVNGKQPGVAGVAAGLHNGIMLVAGGANFPDSMPWLGGKKKYHDDVYAFRREAGGQLSVMDTLFKLHHPLAYAASISTGLGIVCVGGENEIGISNEAFLMKWDEGNKRVAISKLPSLPGPLTNASITANGMMIYVAGGEMPDAVSNSFLCLDLKDTASGWKTLTPLPYPVSHAVLAFSDDVIYLAGGRKKNAQGVSTFYSDLYAYDTMEKKWNKKSALPYGLSAATGMATESGLMIFGGDKGETFHRTESLNAQIAATVHAAEKQRLNQQKTALQSAHPGFTREVLQYHAATNEWKITDTIPYEVPVTTTAFRWEDDIIIPSGEIKAGIRTPNILAGKLKE